jgi:hypothetical protein
MKTLNCNRLRIGCVVLFVFQFITLFAQNKGSRPETPYGSNQIIDKKVIQEEKDIANKNIELILGDSSLFDVSLGYTTKNKKLDGKKTSFLNYIENDITLKVELANISKFIVIKQGEKFVKMQVEIFPNISPDELNKLRPSNFKEFHDKYTLTKTVNVKLQNKNGSYLSFLSNTEEGNTIVNFSSLKDTIQFRTIKWWAIPSLATSEDYPYKKAVKY